jgi:hypothetical protein
MVGGEWRMESVFGVPLMLSTNRQLPAVSPLTIRHSPFAPM